MKQFIKILEKDIEELHLSKHPFYQLWNEGTVSKKALQEYAKEYYQFVNLFPRMVSSIHSNTEDQEDRFMILENLNEEENPKEPHADLWVQFAQGLDVIKSSMKVPKLAETKKSMKILMDTCKSGFLEGAAAALAYEAQIPEIAELKMKGLKKHYNIKDVRSLRFFKVHSKVDIEHQKTWKKIIANAMKQDFSWDKQVNEYISLYSAIMKE